MITAPRSLLYVPAVKPSLFDKAAAGPADAVIIDLEDAVPLQHKASARRDVSAWLTSSGATSGSAAIWVRVTPDFLEDDLDAAAHRGIAGVMVAKCTVDALERTHDLLSRHERERDFADTPVIGLVETAHSLRSVHEMAAIPRVLTFGLGEVDLLADLRVRRTPGTAGVIDQLRTELVIGCAAAGIAAPIAPTSTDFRDLTGFVASTEHLVNLGFRGRTAVHPTQIPIINAALTPTSDDVQRARRLVELFDTAEGGPTVDDHGRFVDEAVVRGAREILARA